MTQADKVQYSARMPSTGDRNNDPARSEDSRPDIKRSPSGAAGVGTNTQLAMRDHLAVLDLVQAYFRGIYEGKPDSLREVFHDNARVEDMITGAFRSRSVDEYLLAVSSRQSPLAAGDVFAMAPISIEVLNDVATVTAELRFLGNHFFNVLSLLRCDGQWLITHKLFGRAGQ